jgi:hypothetical protein
LDRRPRLIFDNIADRMSHDARFDPVRAGEFHRQVPQQGKAADEQKRPNAPPPMIGRGNGRRERRQNRLNEKGDEDIRILNNRDCVERMLDGEPDDTLDELMERKHRRKKRKNEHGPV